MSTVEVEARAELWTDECDDDDAVLTDAGGNRLGNTRRGSWWAVMRARGGVLGRGRVRVDDPLSRTRGELGGGRPGGLKVHLPLGFSLHAILPSFDERCHEIRLLSEKRLIGGG